MAEEERAPAGLVYTLPGVEDARVRRDLAYKVDAGSELRCDVYSPPDLASGESRPGVIFIHGDGPAEYLVGIKDSPQYVGWGRLAAASGLVGVTFYHRSTERFTRVREAAADVDDLVAFIRRRGAELRLDPERLCAWVCSAGPPVGLAALLRDAPPFLRAVVAYYGVMDLVPPRSSEAPVDDLEALAQEFSPLRQLGRNAAALPPMLLARAGRDSAALNETMDRFYGAALERNLAVEMINHPAGRHGFDFLDDDDRSREIIARTLAFMRHHLTSP